MAEEQQTAHQNRDTEAAAMADGRELSKKKRTKCILFIILFVIFQFAVITAFSLTVMRVKTPKFRIVGATFTTINTNGTRGLQATMVPRFSLKNTNFGRYEYYTAFNTTVEFFYGDAKIGEASVPNSKVGWISTKRIIVPAVDLAIATTPQLSSHLSTGLVPIRCSARMTGMVELMFIIKKNRDTNMNCNMDIAIATNALTNISCNS